MTGSTKMHPGRSEKELWKHLMLSSNFDHQRYQSSSPEVKKIRFPLKTKIYPGLEFSEKHAFAS